MTQNDVRTTAARTLTNAERLAGLLRSTRAMPLELKALALCKSGLLPPSEDVSPGVVRVPSATNWYSTHEWHEIVDGICPCPAVQNGKGCYHPHYAQACRDGFHGTYVRISESDVVHPFTPRRGQLLRDVS